MAGRRQPTALLEANGRKHLTEAEADARRDQEVYVAPPEAAVPPCWLPKKLHKEFREIGEIFGRTENWARVTYYRAKTMLAERLEE